MLDLRGDRVELLSADLAKEGSDPHLHRTTFLVSPLLFINAHQASDQDEYPAFLTTPSPEDTRDAGGIRCLQRGFVRTAG